MRRPIVAENAATLPPRRGRRPRVDGEPSSVRIWGFITLAERRELRRVARDSRMTIAEVIREAVNEFVADYSEKRICTTGNSRRPSS